MNHTLYIYRAKRTKGGIRLDGMSQEGKEGDYAGKNLKNHWRAQRK